MNRTARLSRTAAGSRGRAAGQDGDHDGPVRYTAPSVVFERDGTADDRRRVSAGRGLRRPGPELRPDARAPSATRDARPAAGALPGRRDHPGNGGADDARQRCPRPLCAQKLRCSSSSQRGGPASAIGRRRAVEADRQRVGARRPGHRGSCPEGPAQTATALGRVGSLAKKCNPSAGCRKTPERPSRSADFDV